MDTDSVSLREISAQIIKTFSGDFGGSVIPSAESADAEQEGQGFPSTKGS